MDILVSELKKLNGLGEIGDGLNSYKNFCYKIGIWHFVIWFNGNIDSIFITKTKMGFVRIIPPKKII